MQKSYKILEFDKVLEILSGYAISEPAKKRCLETEILDDIFKIKYELNLVTEARRVYDFGFEVPIDDIKDILKSLNDANRYIRLSEQELYDIAQVLRTSRLTYKFLEKFDSIKDELLKTKIKGAQELLSILASGVILTMVTPQLVNKIIHPIMKKMDEKKLDKKA